MTANDCVDYQFEDFCEFSGTLAAGDFAEIEGLFEGQGKVLGEVGVEARLELAQVRETKGETVLRIRKSLREVSRCAV